MNKPYLEGVIVPIDTNEECSICLDNDEYTYKSWVKLNHCSHQYHRHCIDLWLEKHRTCPLCMRDVYIPHRNDQHTTRTSSLCIGGIIVFFLSIFGILGWIIVSESQRR